MTDLDPQYLTIATAIIGVISSIITQTAKRYVPDKWRNLFALGISVLVSAIAVVIHSVSILLSGGHLTIDAATLTTMVFGVIGVAQTIYAAVYKLVADKATDDKAPVDKPDKQ